MFEHQIDAEYLRRCLDYKPDTGNFTWKTRPREHFAREQYWRVWNTRFAGTIAGATSSGGYRLIGISSRRYHAHRLAFLYMTGCWPVAEIDHINHVKDDNRFCNLREVTHQENTKNLPLYVRNTSGAVGVYWHKGAKKWQALIRVDGRLHHLGLFPSKEQAVARRKFCQELLGFHEMHGTPSCNRALQRTRSQVRRFVRGVL